MSRQTGLWPLRLLSLAVAIVLWLVLSYGAREEARLERALDAVNVTYDTPAGFVLMNPVSAVALRVEGTESAIQELNPFQVSAQVDLAPTAGIQEIVLDASRISRPAGIDVLAITPDRLSLQVDREITKSLRVEVDGQGEPVAGAIEGEHRVVPDTVTVRGPESLLARQDVILAPINLNGRAKSFAEQVPLDTRSPLVQVQGSNIVTVQVVLETPELSPDVANGAGAAAPGS